jgi:antirestriction protein ArdC
VNIPAGFRSASYLAHWLGILKEDNRAIFSAASYASHAADYIAQKEHEVTGEDDPDELPGK